MPFRNAAFRLQPKHYTNAAMFTLRSLQAKARVPMACRRGFSPGTPRSVHAEDSIVSQPWIAPSNLDAT